MIVKKLGEEMELELDFEGTGYGVNAPRYKPS